MTRGLTPSQTVGPFFQIGLKQLFRPDIVPTNCKAEPIVITGRILDADGEPVPDAVLEVWQADEHGKYPSVERATMEQADFFSGWARIPTDEFGNFKLRTIKPGRVPGFANTPQAPHLNVTIFMRGLLRHLFTRMYFGGDPSNQMDPVLLAIPAVRRLTLLASQSDGTQDQYSWNILLQGDHETVFFGW